jgi:hypothetical protein
MECVRGFFRAVIVGTILVPPAVPGVAQDAIEPETPTCAAPYLGHTATVDGFVFKTYWNVENEDGCLEVSRNGGVVFRESSKGGEYTLGQPANRRYGVPKVADGTDLTGRGHPDMIVSNWSGGAHCCFTRYIFELEPEFKLLATLDDADAEFGHFVDLDQNHRYYYQTFDFTFEYWRVSFAESPAPKVILRFVDDGKEGAYQLALDKMKRPEPTVAEWQKDLQEARAAFGKDGPSSNRIGSELWGDMLNFIYGGQSDLAWKLLDGAWPANRDGKDDFLSDFCSQLKSSPYWPDLEKAVPTAPPVCKDAEPNTADM